MFSSVLFCVLLSSAGKGPFMAGKAKNMPQRCTFLVGAGGQVSGVRDMASPLEELSSLKHHSLISEPSFMKNGR